MKESVNQPEIDNARIGYQVAVSLWIYEGELLWSKFNTLIVANSIILATTSLTMSTSNCLKVFSIGMPIVGITLCGLWFLLAKRGFSNHRYWILSARELEENFLRNSVKTISRGGDFRDGKKIEIKIGNKPKQLQMSCYARLLRDEWISYFFIGVFLAIYVVILLVNIM